MEGRFSFEVWLGIGAIAVGIGLWVLDRKLNEKTPPWLRRLLAFPRFFFVLAAGTAATWMRGTLSPRLGYAVAIFWAFVALWILEWLVGFFVRERAVVAAAAPPAAKLEAQQLRVPHAPAGASGAQRTIRAEMLPRDELKLRWATLERGVALLREQFDQVDWKPDLVIAVNPGGAVVASMLFAKQGRDLPTGHARVAGAHAHRSLVFLSLPAIADAPKARVLIVDIQMKSGSALDVLMAELVRRGFAPEQIRVAALTLGHLKPFTRSDAPVPLSPELFPQRQDTQPPTYSEWLGRLHFIGFLSLDDPRPPWDD